MERGLRKGLTAYGDQDFSWFLRKAFIKAVGYSDDALDRPVVGIADTASDYNPCHGPCHGNAPALIEAVKRGVMQSGALPMVGGVRIRQRNGSDRFAGLEGRPYPLDAGRSPHRAVILGLRPIGAEMCRVGRSTELASLGPRMTTVERLKSGSCGVSNPATVILGPRPEYPENRARPRTGQLCSNLSAYGLCSGHDERLALRIKQSRGHGRPTGIFQA